MERSQCQAFALGAGITAVILAIVTGRLPRWVRVTLVLGIVLLACGGGFYTYRYATHPTILTVAAGSSDGEAVRLMSTIATRLASTNSSVRLQVIDKGDALQAVKAFSGGEADLAVVRADIGNLSAAETVVVVTRGVVLIVAPPGSSIAEMEDLKGKTVGIVGGDVNHIVVDALTREYGLDALQTHFQGSNIYANGRDPQVQASRRHTWCHAADGQVSKYVTKLVS